LNVTSRWPTWHQKKQNESEQRENFRTLPIPLHSMKRSLQVYTVSPGV